MTSNVPINQMEVLETLGTDAIVIRVAQIGVTKAKVSAIKARIVILVLERSCLQMK